MNSEFRTFMHKLNLPQEENKILVAVSGGIDSIVLLDLLVKSGYLCGVAHCNFKLRGKESNDDEKFVKKITEKYKLPFFSISFDTIKNASESGISIQMAARDLRYNWFEQIREEKFFDYIAVAHNSNDNIETFLINIIRGTGIKGISGMQLINGKIIRPLLFANRKKIEKYALDNKLKFREDSSNSETKYTRNKIRKQIIPLFKEINESIENTILENIQRFSEIEQIYDSAIDFLKEKILQKKGENISLNILELKKLSPLPSCLYEFLKEYNFKKDHIPFIINILDSETGRKIYSETHQLIKDRNFLVLSVLKKEKNIIFLIDQNTQQIHEPLSLTFTKKNITKEFKISKDPAVAILDFDKLKFPLILRKWQSGDSFYPLGMNKKKKISDFFIDEKFSLIDKQNTWLLISDDKIASIIGYRIDNRFKIIDKTNEVFIVAFKK